MVLRNRFGQWHYVTPVHTARSTRLRMDRLGQAGYQGPRKFFGVTFGNNTFVASGEGGKIITSTQWGRMGPAGTGDTNDLSAVTVRQYLFVAVGNWHDPDFQRMD